MTAANLIVQPHAAYLITDTAAYLPDGTVTHFQAKAIELPFALMQPAAMCLTGNLFPQEIMPIVAKYGNSASELVTNLPRILEAGERILDRRGLPRDQQSIYMAVAAYDVASQRTYGAVIGNGDYIFAAGYTPRSIQYVRFHVSADHVQMVERLKLPQDPALGIDYANPQQFNVERDAAVLLEQQRSEVEEGRSIIGGQGIVTRVDSNGPKSFAVCEWPDRVGERIAA